MIVFDHIPMGDEGLKEVYQWLDDWVAKNKGLARKQVIGKSLDHWDIPAIFITNEALPDEDKQIAVVTLGRHGQELGTRIVGPEIIRYLCSSDAEEIRKTQLVIVVPVVNPEGFISNEFRSSMTSLTKTERLVLGGLFKEFPPDMMIDFHSLGKTEAQNMIEGIWRSSSPPIQPGGPWTNRFINMSHKKCRRLQSLKVGLMKSIHLRI
jgi:hypothetical protein